MWDSFAFDCFDFKVRPATPATNPMLPRQSDLKVSADLSYCAILLTHFIISIAVLENVPPDAGVQKRATFPH
jgi:hypothetical protein